MSDTTRDLLISLASHMAYMQGQLEARHELDDPDDFYWYRESVLLRQKVADHLAAEAQQPSSSLPELRSSPPTVMEIIELSEKAEAAGLGQVDFARAVLARWGNAAPVPPADGEVAELAEMLKGIAYWKRHGKPGEPAPTSFDIRQADRLDRAAELLQRQALVSVAVSERPWEREGWCDAEGNCWLGGNSLDGCTPTWLYGPPAWAERFPNVHRVLLPAHALPLPEADK